MSRILSLALILAVAPATAWARKDILPTKKGHDPSREAEENPLYDVAGDMERAARRLKEAKTDDTTQDIQLAIIEKLDRLIEQAQKESEKPPPSGKGDDPQRKPQPQPQPSPEDQKKAESQKQEPKPASAEKKKESERPGIGPPGKGEATGSLHTDAEEWGNLPPAIRDQLLQSLGEGFPLKYRELLRRYYLELSKPRE